MAYVDFSNAQISVRGSAKPLTAQYLGLSNYNSATTNANFITLTEPYDAVAQSVSMSIVQSTPTKYSLLFTGSFLLAGTGFDIAVTKGNAYTYEKYWRITNVSFSAGDTFSFIVDVEITGS